MAPSLTTLGKLPVVRCRLLQRYEHQPFVSCLAGLYGCQWRRYQRTRATPGDCCCSKLECASFALLIVTFCLTLVFLYFWSEAQNDYNDFDWFNFGNLGFWFPWSVVLLVIAAAFFSYITLLLLGRRSSWGCTWRCCVPSTWCPWACTHPVLKRRALCACHQPSSGTEGHPCYDGVPFLMHDHTLRRTTNVQEVFPNRTDAPAAMFTWGELETLNAGAWFLHRDPFSTAWSLSAEDRAQAQNQSICTFRDFLELASQREKQVIFDLYRPPEGHPYRDTWITRTLEVIQNESSIHSHQVLWLPSDLRSLVQQLDPDLQHTSASRAPVEELHQNHIVQLNLHYSSMSTEMIIEYAAANISTNLYVISQSWLYSLAWCTGAQSVTTNALQFLNNLSRPLFLMTPDEYNLMWVLTDVVSITIIIIIFIFHWWREQSLAFCSGSKPTLEHGTYIKFRTDVWSVSSVNILGEPAEPNLATVSEH
uniref:glycerophosphodiester phosphodiesterase domain-containing protein 5-like isoform X5 n=1 Tax=Oncorhynchus gorbuscha TaxID=8017 RepID=UPI001EAF41F6|nr:glycerophosphodiester phosphodiesterase domain-containing protein 5-like isoform X5 [Oncorhynchus gorbuscha]